MKKFLSLLFLTASMINAQGYDFEVLETLGGTSIPYGINSNGDIVGYSSDEYYQYPVLWDKEENDIEILGDLGNTNGCAEAINSSIVIVGVSTTYLGDYHAFMWDDEVMTDLGTLEGTATGYYSDAKAINDSGLIVGWSTHSEGVGPRACVWTDGGTEIHELSTQWSEASGVNSSGQVVGWVDRGNWEVHGFLIEEDEGEWYQDEDEDDINDLMVDIWLEGSYDVQPMAINDSGLVTGQIGTSAGTVRVFTWTEVGGLVVINDTLEYTTARALAVNNSDILAGYCNTGDDWTGFLYDCGTSTMTDANDYTDSGFYWDILAVYGINDDDAFIGIAMHGANSCAFKMLPQDSKLFNPLKKFNELGD